MSDPVYCYPPDHTVLKNKLGIRDKAALERAERRLVTQRIREGVPNGDFDFAHLKAIHRHLFQDLFTWAGETRTVEISKDNSQFQLVRFIKTGMADVYRRIVEQNYFEGSDADMFAEAAGRVIGDVNYVHPFREGNGRAQLQYLKLLAERAGRRLDLARLDPAQWLEASRAAMDGNYQPISRAIRKICT